MDNRAILVAGLKRAQEVGGFIPEHSNKEPREPKFTLQSISQDIYRLIVPGTKEGKECIAIIDSNKETWAFANTPELLCKYRERALNKLNALQIAPIMSVLRDRDTVIIFQEMKRTPKRKVLPQYPLSSVQEKDYIARTLYNSAEIFPQDTVTVPYASKDFFLNTMFAYLTAVKEQRDYTKSFIDTAQVTRLRELFLNAPDMPMRNFFSDINETLLTQSGRQLYLWHTNAELYPLFFETALWMGAVTVHSHGQQEEWLENELHGWLNTFVKVYEHYDAKTIMHTILLNLATEYLRLLANDLTFKIGLVQKYNDEQLHNTVTIVRASLNTILKFL